MAKAKPRDPLQTQTVGLPEGLQNLMLGRTKGRERACWIALLTGLLLLVPLGDYGLGRGLFHLNLYPLPVILSIFLFGELGLLSVLVMLTFYHSVQVRLGLEPQTMLINNLGQLGVTFLVGLLSCWLVRALRALYQEKANLALSRHQLLLSLTHEIRSPLFAVRGIVRNLGRNISKLSAEEVRAQLNDAHAAIASINQDVEGLTQVFRTDLEECEPNFEEVVPAELIAALAKRHPAEFHPDHTFHYHVDPGVGRLVCDRLLSLQILDNLLSNALRHSPGGEIGVEIVDAGEEVLLRVSDQGRGIRPADLERIFGRFEKAAGTVSSGFGVGLYLVDLYTRVQGGRVDVDSSPAGACFRVYLPRREL